MKVRCMLCGMLIEEEVVVAKPDPFDEDDEDMPRKKLLSVCLRCQAKLKYEAEGAQKIPKPM